MAQLSKKQYAAIIIGGLLLSAGAYAVWLTQQAKKLVKYGIGFKSIKIKNVSLNNINFDLFLDFTNTSDLTLKLREQEYDVYINGVYLTKLVNRATNVLKPNQTSVLGLNVDLDTKEIAKRFKMNPLALANIGGNSDVKIIMRVKLKLGFFNIQLPKYTYEDKLKNLA